MTGFLIRTFGLSLLLDKNNYISFHQKLGMNIKINKDQAKRIIKYRVSEDIIFGSRLYGTDSEKSDVDIMILYDEKKLFPNINLNFLPNIHQFQYDNIEKKSQIIFTYSDQFMRNLVSGDSTINADILMFSDKIKITSPYKSLDVLFSYKIIKSYLGFVKRDLQKPNGKNKLFHAKRGVYIAECLLRKELPDLNTIKSFSTDERITIKDLKYREAQARIELNKLLHKKEINHYYIPENEDDLLNSLLKSNNVNEFKY